MKPLQLILVALLLSLPSLAQESGILPIDRATGKVSYSGIIDVKGQSKQQLFNQAKQWVTIKNTDANPYSVVIEDEIVGTLTGKGAFSLTAKDRKYTIAFTCSILMKDGKYKYDFTDLLIQFTTQGGVSSGGYGYWSSTTYKDAETLEHSLETFYPIRLEKRRKPSIKWYELINRKSFETIDVEMVALVNSLTSSMNMAGKW